MLKISEKMFTTNNKLATTSITANAITNDQVEIKCYSVAITFNHHKAIYLRCSYKKSK